MENSNIQKFSGFLLIKIQTVSLEMSDEPKNIMLQENGFILKSQKGSHMKFEKDGRVVVVPNHNSKGVEKGTYYSILRQAGLK